MFMKHHYMFLDNNNKKRKWQWSREYGRRNGWRRD